MVTIIIAVLISAVIVVGIIRELIHIRSESTTPIPTTANAVHGTPSTLPFSTSGVIYFASGFDSVGAMKADGAGAESVYSLPGADQSQGQITSLDASRNGSEIVYTYSQDTTTGKGQDCIFSLSTDGSDPTSLTPNCTATGSPNDDSQAVLSADGKTVYFFSYGRANEPGIYKEPSSGGNATLVVSLPHVNPITNRPVPPSSLALSPDGSTLAFPYFKDLSLIPHLYTVHTDGTGLSELASAPAYVDEVNEWSPDGSQLLAVTGSNNGNLQILNARTGAIVRTLATATVEQAFARASWSPDGSLIAYDLNGALEDYNIYLIRSSGGTSYQITSAGRNRIPEWTSQISPPLGGAPIN